VDVGSAVEATIVVGPVTPAASTLSETGVTLAALGGEAHVHQFDAGGLGHLLNAYVSVELPKDNALNPRPSRKGEAVVARAGRHVEGAAFCVLVGACGLEDSIGLGMDRANAVSVFHQAADIRAVGLPGEASVVPRQDDALVADDDSSHRLPRAGG